MCIRDSDEIDRMGGAVEALEQGYQAREVHDSAYRHQQEVEEGKRVVVGVNRYQVPAPPVENLQAIDPEETRKQLERLERVREERDGAAVEAALARLHDVASGSDNTIPAILECVEAYATVGEIADVLRAVFGEQGDPGGF